jgi:hypothetical protein
MKPSHQVSYDMRLPPNKKIPVKNDQYIQGTPCKGHHVRVEFIYAFFIRAMEAIQGTLSPYFSSLSKESLMSALYI